MPGMQPERISGTSPYEAVFGFSRAVVAGRRILVSGTTPFPAAGGLPPDGPSAQARLCLDRIAAALDRAVAGLEHVIRPRMYLTDASLWPEVARAHGEAVGGTRPA